MTTAKIAIGIALGLLLFAGGCLTFLALTWTPGEIQGARSGVYADSVRIESADLGRSGLEGVALNTSQRELRSVQVRYHLFSDGVRRRAMTAEVRNVQPGERVRFFIATYRH
jgi:hypothetical protein